MLAVVVTVPWTRQRWALPFLCVLATTPEVSAHLGIRHKTLGMRARQVVSLLRRWLPGVPIKLMGDMAYSILELGVHCAKEQIAQILASHYGLLAPERASYVDAYRPTLLGAAVVWQCLLHDLQARPGGDAYVQ